MADSPIKQFIDAGVQFSEVSRKQAESLVKGLVKAGEVRRKDAEGLVQTLIERGRQTSEQIAEAIQKEVAKQVDVLKAQYAEVEARVEQLTQQLPRRRNAGQESARQEGARQEGARQEGARQEGARQEGARQESARQESTRQESGWQFGCPTRQHQPPGLSPRRGVGARRRLDADLVRRGLVTSRTEAQSLIDEHRVLVNGAIAEKSSRQVATGDQVVVSGPPSRFVGRGAFKLDHALDAFGIDVTGLRALDAGASTGGFTDCLLQRGAAHVVAVDVGHGQLHERLCGDDRVTNLERTNVRHIDLGVVGGPVELVVGDLSFISLRLVIAPLVSVCQPGAAMVLLVKPQFEAGRAEVSRGRGIVTDPEVWERVRGEVADAFLVAGCDVVGWTDSPITGADGNHEFLVHAVTPPRSP